MLPEYQIILLKGILDTTVLENICQHAQTTTRSTKMTFSFTYYWLFMTLMLEYAAVLSTVSMQVTMQN